MKQTTVFLVCSFLASMALSACGSVTSGDSDGGEATVDASQDISDGNDTPTICTWGESKWDECDWAP